MDLLQKVHELLIKSKKTISVAESVTGGLLSKVLTDLSGASNYFRCGVVAYSNETKIKRLGINKRIIDEFGVVSEQVTRGMAVNIRKKVNTDYSLSCTGYASPSADYEEASQEKVGLVFIGFSSSNKTIVKNFKFTGPRSEIREQTVKQALELLLENID